MLLVVGYYDELTHEKEMGPYNPQWDDNSVGVWMEQNPEIDEDDPDYNNKNEVREYELSKQWDIYNKILHDKYLWTVSRKRVFAIVELQFPLAAPKREIQYIVDHVNDMYIVIDGKQEHITEVTTFDIKEWTAMYISIYENDNFLNQVKIRQIDFASSVGHELDHDYLNEPKICKSENVLIDMTLRKNTLFANQSRMPLYDRYDYSPRYFHAAAVEYVQNTNFGPTISSNDEFSYEIMNKIKYPRNTDTYYQYELSNYVFNRYKSTSQPLSDSLLETAGVRLLDDNYVGKSLPTDNKLLLSSVFNLVNLLILDSYYYGKNERYYLTPSMKVLMQTFSQLDIDEIKKEMDEYYMYIIGIIRATIGPIRSELEGIIKQSGEVSFKVLRSIALYSRVHWNQIRVMKSDIDDSLKSHEPDVAEALIDDHTTDSTSRYVMYDKSLITKSRIHMESLFLHLSTVKT